MKVTRVSPGRPSWYAYHRLGTPDLHKQLFFCHFYFLFEGKICSYRIEIDI